MYKHEGTEINSTIWFNTSFAQVSSFFPLTLHKIYSESIWNLDYSGPPIETIIK